MKSKIAWPPTDAYHFMLSPPADFIPHRMGAEFKTGLASWCQKPYAPVPAHHVFWQRHGPDILVMGDKVDVVDIMAELVASRVAHVPLAYLLVAHRFISPGNVLDLLSQSQYVPPVAVSETALEIMLGAWVEPLDGQRPLVNGRPIDIGGAGLDAYIDSDPVTEAIFNDTSWSRENRNGMTLGVMRRFLQEQALFAGELPAAILARTPRSVWWRYGMYMRGTLRQVFAGLLQTKTVLGQLPADPVRPGPHTDDAWR